MTNKLAGKPNFGSDNSGTTSADSSTGTNTANGNNFMKQTGAIWEKISNDGNTKYLSLSLETKELEGIINKARTDNRTKIDLVAFLNNKDGNENRPDFRIFESKKRI